MPLDTRIPLQATGGIDLSSGINALSGAFQYRDRQKERKEEMGMRREDQAMRREEFDLRKGEIAANKELRDLQVAAAKFSQLDTRNQWRTKSNVIAAAQLNGFLESGDIEGAQNFLQTRKSQIEQAKSIFPDLDTNETDRAIEELKSGDIETMKKVNKTAIAFGQMIGVLQKPEKADGFTLGEGQKRFDAEGKPIASVAPASKLLTPEEEAQKTRLAKAGASNSSNTVYMPGALTPAKTTQGKIDDSLMESGGRLMRLDNIAASFQPKFQTFSTQMGSRWAALKERGGVGLSGAEKKSLTEYSQFKAGSLSNLNLYIKEITGAAMSEVEADRIRQAMPDPGSGLFDGDSPTQFKAKLDDAIRLVKMAESRSVYLKRNGMSLANEKGEPLVPLERMPALINKRGKEIELELKQAQPGVDPAALKRAVMRQLGQEFGLAAD